MQKLAGFDTITIIFNSLIKVFKTAQKLRFRNYNLMNLSEI
jgi:hypothetical protein